MFTVRINKLKVRTKIGVSVQERKKQQLLLVSIKFSYKVSNKKNVDNKGCLQIIANLNFKQVAR